MSSLPTGGTLILPVANRETSARLLATAIDLARERSMQLLVLHVVEVPAQLPLSEGDVLLDDDGQEQRMLETAARQCTEAGVEAETRLRFARDIATGIVGSVPEHGGDGLLMGWRGRPRRRDIILGSFLDRVLAEAPCDVFIKRIRRPPTEIDSILVPVAGGLHCGLSVMLAEAIGRQHDASVLLIHVVPEDASPMRLDEGTAILDQFTETLTAAGLDTESSILHDEHVAGAITDSTPNHDLTILGATRGSFLKRKLIGSVAEGVGRAASSQVIVTRSAKNESNT